MLIGEICDCHMLRGGLGSEVHVIGVWTEERPREWRLRVRDGSSRVWRHIQ